MSINRVMITGNLTRDPELRMAGATPLCQIGVAVNDRKKNNDTGEWEDVPNFFDVLIWGARGEFWAKNLSKGNKVAIAGKLRWSSWETPEGQKRSKVEIVADDIESLNPRGEGGGASASVPASPEPVTSTLGGDEIPF